MTDETMQLKEDLARLKKECGIDVEVCGPEAEDCCRHKHREASEAEALTKRLNRIEGQVRGIRGMVESEAYCTDILTQVSAVQSALNAFSRELLASHIRTCVVTDIQNGQLEVVDDLLATIQKLMK
ncbi:metal-sensing transcriptional repressor [Oscillibacter sp.]|uniref:metal-sensing transcriptional repressor n=1 Tax=Oscillibacter sp. TaxID=1945593 RepID=UPI002DBBC5F8|nr:metal-sensing transcriptional repressor [Oscillibacter sp.]